MHLQPKRWTGLIVSQKASSFRPKRSEVEKSPHFAFAVACFPTQRFTKHRHFDRSEAKWRNPRISLFPLPVFQPNASQSIVISTEAKRSGEIPASRFFRCLFSNPTLHKASSFRPKRSEVEKSPHLAFAVACFPTQRFTKYRHFDRSEAKWRNPRISPLPLPVFQPNASQSIVISTEAKRSGEIPASRLCRCLFSNPTLHKASSF